MFGRAVLGGCCTAVRETLWPSPPPSNGMEQVVEALKAHGLGGAREAVAEAVKEAPRPVKAAQADPAAKRASRIAALRYTTSLVHGGERPSLDGVEPAVAARLRQLATRIEAAPVHRALVAALGYECKAGWWDGPHRDRRNDDAAPVSGKGRALAC